LNLEQQKKRARELLRGIRAGDAAAIERLRRHHLRWAEADVSRLRQLVALHDAQFALAREQGFASWPKLKAFAEAASVSRHTRLFVADVGWIEDRARGLLRTHASGVPAALEQIREWHPRFTDAADEDIRRARFTEDDARLVYAREHGFETWKDLAARTAALAAGRTEEPFMAAFKALETGNLPRAHALLRAHPELATARGTNGNTLLNLEASLFAYEKKGHGARGGAPIGLAGVEALLASGADVNDANDRGWTPLHQAAYANRLELASLLIAAGATPDAEAHGAGGTPLVAALFWGHREVADLLASHAVVPRNLRVAAGIGDPALVESFFTPAGALTADAGAARGFFRPHSGFPDWEPSTDPQEVLDEALVWACKSDRVEVLDRLVRGGARIDADPYRGTPLAWAAFCNRVRAAEWLLDHGAEVNGRGTFGGLSHGKGVTALHLAAQGGCLEVAQLLLERGADASIEDDLYHGTPAGWAEHDGQTHAARIIRSHRARPGRP
jgi:ankyrin repeat protein